MGVASSHADSGKYDEADSYFTVTMKEVGEGCVGGGKVITYTTATGVRIVALPFRGAGWAPRTASTGLLTWITYYGMCNKHDQNPYERPRQEWNETNVVTGAVFALSAGMLAWDWYQSWKKEQPTEKTPENQKNSTSN